MTLWWRSRRWFKKNAGMLADDVERISGIKPGLNSAESLAALPDKPLVVAGTIGNSRLIDELVKSRKVKVSAVKGVARPNCTNVSIRSREPVPLLKNAQ